MCSSTDSTDPPQMYAPYTTDVLSVPSGQPRMSCQQVAPELGRHQGIFTVLGDLLHRCVGQEARHPDVGGRKSNGRRRQARKRWKPSKRGRQSHSLQVSLTSFYRSWSYNSTTQRAFQDQGLLGLWTCRGSGFQSVCCVLWVKKQVCKVCKSERVRFRTWVLYIDFCEVFQPFC